MKISPDQWIDLAIASAICATALVGLVWFGKVIWLLSASEACK